jgi:hypothetical protein
LIASDFVSSAYLKAAGKLPTFTTGSTKWLKILAIANSKIDQWANEYDWNSLYDPKYSLGTVTATDTFNLDDDIRLISNRPGDTITILKLDGKKSEYELVLSSQLKLYPYGNYCAQVGKTLIFNNAFTSTSPEFGGTILCPVYLYPDHLVNDSDEVVVDDPQWLVTVTAAEYVRNDIVKQNQYPGLIQEANSLMDGMKSSIDPQLEELDKPYHVLGQTW